MKLNKMIMPPSGYKKEQSDSVIRFLSSVSDDLKTEGTEKGMTPREALDNEISNIDTIVKSDIAPNESIAAATLDLTRNFYLKILKENPGDWDQYVEIRDKLVVDARKEILDIHVPEIG